MAVRTVSSTQVHVSERMKTAMIALLLGSFFVWGAGLANPQVLHDVAHDSRHALGFPCH